MHHGAPERAHAKQVRRTHSNEPGCGGRFQFDSFEPRDLHDGPDETMSPSATDFPMRCHVESATARPDRRDDLDDLIRQMFNRRNHAYVGGQEKMWLKVELVQSLRTQSRIYRDALSNKMEGPLPFALGFFRLRGSTLEAVSDTLPQTVPPETLVRILSEFVEPGARFWFAQEGEVRGWEVAGEDALQALEEPPPDALSA